jgi:two-component system, LytTR family, response regulator LytT
MKVLIIEDEIPAQLQLERLIQANYPDIEIAAKIDSVKESVKWLNRNRPDLIFMDVELSDGKCFEIFKQVNIDVPVIMTTAYSDYAIKAFKVNSIDYLLKPLDDGDFIQAVEKSKRLNQKNVTAYQDIEKLLTKNIPKEYRERFIVKLSDQIKVLSIDEIAYFIAEEKVTFIVSKAGKRYLIDSSLDSIEVQLNPKKFFRLSRNCVSNISSVKTVSKYFNSRLKIKLEPPYSEDIVVSRIRVQEFLKWLEGL